LADSLTLEQLEDNPNKEHFNPIPPAAALQHLGAVTTSNSPKWCQGQHIPLNALASSTDALRVQLRRRHFLGITQLVKLDEQLLLIPKWFCFDFVVLKKFG